MSESRSAEPRIAVEDRLFSLVLALLATESGLVKSEILRTVRGYAERYDERGRNESLERQFERDKDDLRELGIPLETVEAPDRPGDNQALRYRIPKRLYDLPESLTFTPEEFALLGLAAEVWREASLSADSQRALTKLRSLGVEPREPVIGYAPRLRVREASFEPLRQALDRRQAVRFDYLKPGEAQPRRRTVEPHALVLHEGRWHLHGLDREAKAPRTFLLSRIVDAVHPVPGQAAGFDAPPAGVERRVIDELEEIRLGNVAELEVEAGSDAAVRLGKRAGADAGADAISLHYTDEAILADELAGFGPEVRVVSPASLRDAVVERLRAVATAADGGGV
ncbi:helix-turn-helix transcriptional regulator [Agromyces archimandritae]|uniref:WYL domain-containing protein n=1 Tax=Agromyces archimandritae TaxID=2781962 RepID=A0A975INM7_9MICO|nr:WYL domain-containing protein [Agromyces archimandritae]QTX04762.1 WYL domain-containing protein [Agromyces archimandritae]